MSPSVSLIVMSISKNYLGNSQLWEDVSEMVIGCQMRTTDVDKLQSSIWSSLISTCHIHTVESFKMRNALKVTFSMLNPVFVLCFHLAFPGWKSLQLRLTRLHPSSKMQNCKLDKFHCQNKPTNKINWHGQMIVYVFFCLTISICTLL